jgi:hypothetical protein
VTLRVTDNGSPPLNTNQTFTINVGNANDAPSFTSTPVTAATEDALYTYNVTTADPDGGSRTISAPTLPSWLSLASVNSSNGTATLRGTPTQAHVGNHSVTLRVTDNGAPPLNANQTFTITVGNANDAPVITGQTPNPIGIARNTSLTIQLSHLIVSDPDDSYPSDFSLTVLNGSNYTRTGNTITPASNFTGTLSVPVRVNDGATNSNTFNLQVSVRVVNRPPEVVAPIPSQTGTEGGPFQLRNAAGAATTLAAFFRDPDGDALRYEVSGLPPSGSLVANVTTGAIAGTPLTLDAREAPYVVRVTANDGVSPANELPAQSFNLTISVLNRVDIGLTITATPAPAGVNTAIGWSFVIANAGAQPAGPVEVTAEFAGNPLRFGAVQNCTVTPVEDRQRLTCSISSIGAGASATVVATAQAAQPGDASVTANAVALQPGPIDPNPTNNQASATVNVAETLSAGPAQVLASRDSRKAAAGDINGDGFVDLALAKSAGPGAELYLNVSVGANSTKRRLSDTPTAVAASAPAADVALADLDGDADLDLVMARDIGQANTVLRNDGLGAFTLLSTIDGGTSNDVAAADVDGDRIVDLVFANSGPNTVYLNRTGGTFIRSTALDNDNSRHVIAVDLDLDNLPDLVFANANGPSRFYRNTGGGTFATGVVVDNGGAESVASADFNRDGRPDLVFGQLSAASGPPSNRVYQNNPGASGAAFVLVGRLGASPTIDVLATDIDVDGAADVIVITSTGTHQVYRGNGAGGFSLHPVQFSSPTAMGAALGSFSVDARMDLAVGGTASTGVFINDGRGALGPGDTAPPVIQLVGLGTVSVTVGDTYQDQGATATDDIDGNLTSKIALQNPVNTALVGSYTVTYNVMDTSGNTAQATRTVRVGAREGTGGGGGGAIGLWELALGLLVSFMVLTARSRGNNNASNLRYWMWRRDRGGNGHTRGAGGVCRGHLR